MKRLLQITIISFFFIIVSHNIFSQGKIHPNTAASFLAATPDARGAALGDLGAATSPDAASAYWNSAKYMFVDKKVGGMLSYTPWQKNIVNGINLLYLASYYKIDNNQAVNLSVDYMTYGDVYVKNDFDAQMQSQRIGEYSIAAGYTRRLAQGLSAGINFRYIRAVSGAYQQTPQYGNSFGADISAYYQTPLSLISSNDEIAFGFNLSNIGSKLGTDNTDRYFIPTTMRMGARLTTEISEGHKLSAAMDISKLQVPDPEINDDGTIDNHLDMSASGAIFYSNFAASFSQEFKEITWSWGIEYKYLDMLSVRAGYHYEHTGYSAKNQLGFGAGYKYKMIGIDLSYTVSPNVALDNTLRVGLSVNF